MSGESCSSGREAWQLAQTELSLGNCLWEYKKTIPKHDKRNLPRPGTYAYWKWPSDLAKTRLQWTHLLSGFLTSFFVWIDNDRHGIVRKKWKPIPSYESYHILWQVFPMQLSNHKIGAHPHVQTHSYHLLGYIFSCNFRKLVDMIFRIYIYLLYTYVICIYIYT